MEEKRISRIHLLRRWREVASIVADIVRKHYPGTEVYVFGGAAENRLTINSDIDIATVLDHKPTHEERIKILDTLWQELEKHIPPYYPLEIMVIAREELDKLRGHKIKIL